jgi:hypothetical protein
MLGVDDFAAVFTAVVLVGIVAMVIEVFNHRKPLRDRLTGRKQDLLKFLRKNHLECFDEGEFMVDDFMRVFDEKKEDPEWLASLLTHIKSFYLHTDMASWKLVHMAENRLMKNYAVLLIDEMDDEETENYSFISQVIRECQSTLRMMIERAITETSERTSMKALESLIRKRHTKVLQNSGGLLRNIPLPQMRRESRDVVQDFRTHKRGSLEPNVARKKRTSVSGNPNPLFSAKRRGEEDGEEEDLEEEDVESWPKWGTGSHRGGRSGEKDKRRVSQVQI